MTKQLPPEAAGMIVVGLIALLVVLFLGGLLARGQSEQGDDPESGNFV